MIQYKKKQKRRDSFKKIVIISYLVSFILIFLFHDMGYLKLIQLKKENNKIKKDIKLTIETLNQLEKETIKLKEDFQYIEKIAREEFKMAKKGEKVFTIVNNKLKKGKN
tara:strand:+ start:460 stop:786 length:327 start_codon:yes stop_codon:yes gene_type:complete